MALSNSQYNEIMRTYGERQLQNKHKMDERVREAYLRIPRLKEIDDAISTCSISSARRMLSGDEGALLTLHKDLESLREERAKLLEASGLPADFFAPIYTCPDCKDTGYIDGEKCHCLKQAIIDTIYTQSNIKEILARENFSTFSYDYYQDEERDSSNGLTSLENVEKAVIDCQDFIDNFENKPKNLLFYGDTGIGKTFLSNCVAKEILDKGYSVIYFTAFQLFDILSKGVFDKDAEAIAAHENIFECDLLIIDDLGTEFANTFTSSQLFLIVNERILRRKSTIISTNLNIGQIVEVYSERTFSRISSNYTIVKLFGEDIRIKKRKLHK